MSDHTIVVIWIIRILLYSSSVYTCHLFLISSASVRSISPEDLPNPGIEPRSPIFQVDSIPAEPQGKPKNTGVGSLSLLQQIFLTQESKQGLLHCRWILYQMSYQRSPHRGFSSIQLLSHVQFFATPWTIAHQASLSITNSQSLLKLMSCDVGDAIQPSHPLSSPSSPAFNLSQHQGLFKWVSSSNQVAEVLEFQVQHQSLQWIFRTDFL